MPRIPYPTDDQIAPETKALVKDRLPLNIYRMLMHAPKVMPGWLTLGRAILHGGELHKGLRELAILRTGHLCKAAYEVHQHRRVAATVGLSQAKIDAVPQGADAAPFDETERLILRFTDEVVNGVKASGPTFHAVNEKLGHAGTVELIIAIGFYMTAARLMENLEIEIEAQAPSPEQVQRLHGAATR